MWAEKRAAIEKADLTRIGLTGTHKLVLLMIHGYADTNSDQAWPGIASLAERCCVSDKTVRRAIAEMTEKGILSASRRKRANGSDTSNVVTIHFEALEPLTKLIEPPPAKAADAPSVGGQIDQGGTPILGGGDSQGGRGGTPKVTDHAPPKMTTPELSRENLPLNFPAGTRSPGGRDWSDAFCQAWTRTHRGTKYPFAKAKDGAALSRVREHFGNDFAGFTAAVRRYLEDTDPFVVKQGHNLAFFASRLASYVAAPVAPPGDLGYVMSDEQALNLAREMGLPV